MSQTTFSQSSTYSQHFLSTNSLSYTVSLSTNSNRSLSFFLFYRQASVIGWPDYLFQYLSINKDKKYPIAIDFARRVQVFVIYLKIDNEFYIFAQGGKILPNLVALQHNLSPSLFTTGKHQKSRKDNLANTHTISFSSNTSSHYLHLPFLKTLSIPLHLYVTLSLSHTNMYCDVLPYLSLSLNWVPPLFSSIYLLAS